MEKKYLNEEITCDDRYDPMFSPRFSEIATFMRAPYAQDLDGVDIAFAGVPWDEGTTFMTAHLGEGDVRHGWFAGG